MRWYRQDPREIIGNQSADFVSLANEKVVDAAHRRDARVRDGRVELVGGTELIVLRRNDERAVGDPGERARCKAQVLRPDPDEGDGVGTAAAFEERKDLESAEAVADKAERNARRDRARVIDRRSDVVGLVPAATPLSGARAHAANVEAQRVPP